MKNNLILLSFSLLASPIFAASTNTPWSYEGSTGPEHWGALNPAFSACSKGNTQTPINITGNMPKIMDTALIHYTPLPLDIVNDGDTELTIGKEKVTTNTGHGIQVNYKGDVKNESLTYQGTTYYLKQFHIHTPAETQWNGFHYPMEIHFVNESTDGKVAVLAVFVADDNMRNPAIQSIIDHLPKNPQEEVVVPSTEINMAQLIPMHTTISSFQGSLTTPPCTEGLQWLVYQHPIIASGSQIQALAKAIGHANARPLQALNQRQPVLTNATIEQ